MIDAFLRIVTTTAPDFSVFYEAARHIGRGVNIYQDPTLFTGFNYLPTTLLFLLPFTLLPYQIALMLWTIGSFEACILSIYLSLRLCLKKFSVVQFIIVFALTLWAFPTKFTFGMGQINFYALAALLYGLWLIKKNQVLAGVLFGLTILLKPQLGIILLPLVVFHLYRVLITAGAVNLLALFISGIVFDWQQVMNFWSIVLPRVLPWGGREIYYNQGISGFVARMSYGEGAAWALTIAVVTIYLYVFLTRRASIVDGMLASLPLMLLVEPLSWQHHYVFLLPVFIWLWVKAKKDRFFLLISYLAIAVNIRQPGALSGTLLGNIVLSHVFFGNAILFVLSIYALARRHSSG
ncbi:DUF2029 domain-containing protein [Candidatus Gottesmanbacteria bacterium]|nr:DUF2029 domain-containing protein [Candidatus Gottesmanbacteria bacterium]